MLCTFGSILLQCLSFFQPGFFSPSSSHPSSLTRIVAVGPGQLSVAYRENVLFWKRRTMDPINSIWERRTPSYGTTHAEAAVSECGLCVAYFKRRWTNVTNVKKLNSRPAQK